MVWEKQLAFDSQSTVFRRQMIKHIVKWLSKAHSFLQTVLPENALTYIFGKINVCFKLRPIIQVES